ncbi:hypothetical protein FACS189474_4980 [Bacteroidia bacterium]|nr:hypothetical protein FACS189474_4980 [Bacteroidia bacterium]
MKKFTLSALLVVLFTACTKEYYEEVNPHTFTETYRIYAKDMIEKVDPAGTYFEYEIKEPKLTNEVFDYGIMQAFLYYTKDGKNTLCPLPFSDFIVDNNNYQWEEQFTVEFQPGVIKFIQKISDHAIDPPISEYYDIFVRFLW